MTDVLAYFAEDGGAWLEMLVEHLAVSALALAVAIVVAVPLGVICSRSSLVERVTVNVAGVLRIVPSLAVLIICVPFLGVGTLPAVVALTLLAIPPILINTAVALVGVDANLIEAAAGMGMTRAQVFWRVQAPLAFPVAFSGVRTAAIEVIASASLAAYIGAGGLGVLIYTGIGALRFDLLWIGGLSVAALSLVVGRILGAVEGLVRTRLHLT